MPPAKWLNKFNEQIVEPGKKIDLILLVLERKTRVSITEELVIAFLKEGLKDFKCDNFYLIWNKAKKGKDTPEFVAKFYNDALKHCKAEELP